MGLSPTLLSSTQSRHQQLKDTASPIALATMATAAAAAAVAVAAAF